MDRLLAAYVAGEKSLGKVKRSGAIFASVWSSWRPPILPSSIQPHYQANSAQPLHIRKGLCTVDPPSSHLSQQHPHPGMSAAR